MAQDAQNATAAPATTPAPAGFSQHDLVGGGSIFTEQTIALGVTLVLIGALSLQLARGYFLRTLDKFTLRLGADIWWLTYVLLRDGLLFVALLMGFEVFYVGTFADYPIAVPFMPLAIALVALVLVLKLVRDPDEEARTNTWVTAILGIATFAYIFGAVFVTESIVGYGNAGYQTLAGNTIATASGGWDFWTVVYNTFSSTVNTTLALDSFYVTFAMLAILGMYAVAHVLRPAARPSAGAASAVAAVAAPGPATRDGVVRPGGKGKGE